MKRFDTFVESGDRYMFDFSLCKSANGWAQIDTDQDASYYGNWLNPFKLEVMSYAEGDVARFVFDTPQELVEYMAEMDQWNQKYGYKPIKLDPGFNPELKDKLAEVGLADYIH